MRVRLKGRSFDTGQRSRDDAIWKRPLARICFVRRDGAEDEKERDSKTAVINIWRGGVFNGYESHTYFPQHKKCWQRNLTKSILKSISDEDYC